MQIRRDAFAREGAVAIGRHLLLGIAALAALAMSQAAPQRSSAADEAEVLVGAGNIATCTETGDEATAALLDGIAGTVYTLGDNAYEAGTQEEFEQCYAPTWGRHIERTRPSAGNHDYQTPKAAGYFGYFGERAGARERGYYAYYAGSWLIIVLNSNCAEVGGCGPDSEQGEWLRQTLEREAAECILAYWHHPRFSSGLLVGSHSHMEPAWAILHAAGAEVILSAHSHHYERFDKQTGSGVPDDERGIRQFVVGTGGKALHETGDPLATSAAIVEGVHGLLRLDLEPGGYSWQFVAAPAGDVRDEGRDHCTRSERSLGTIVREVAPFALVLPLVVLLLLAVLLRPPRFVVR